MADQAGTILTIKLNDQQQAQIRNATGKSVTEINLRVASGEIRENDLDQVAGGAFNAYLTFHK